ncbi:extracellular solute-binding protein [Desulfobulbus oligotrophicus]|uniref:Extracellular solute-binding protein n=1 Tax=Desulfobulbus oligotrophicus TaxID=1909699 RepID=A0A7T6ARB6_9BACT|nr:extracellular solute-binding protein [Desulfobulbus oligotrophicus]MDY0390171.1 extracellular solute-binding protein [Desulfobulbus oligotrophicus]QQG66382.1 extracellular solute-binding protein [Desulfobulbus oligotrophicus]
MKTFLTSACLILFMLMAAVSTSLSADKVLNLFIWSEYMPDEVLADFTRETGIRVNIATYDSNEAMYAKIKLVGKGYDLIVPSSDYVGLMRRQGMLNPIDVDKISNFQFIAPQFVNQSFDPGNKYSIPYMWGSTALAINTALLPAQTVQKLADLWKPELKGRLLLPNDPREVIGIGLKTLGYSINERDPEHLQQAFEKLRLLKPSIRVFDSDSPKQAILSGEVAAGVMWNGEAFIANKENSMILYTYPAEGFSLWLDSFCIPKGAVNIDAAHRFIDYILQPKVAAFLSRSIGYSSPNAKVSEHLPEEMMNNPIVYPPAEDSARGEFLDSLDEKTMKLYEQYWIQIKSK